MCAATQLDSAGCGCCLIDEETNITRPVAVLVYTMAAGFIHSHGGCCCLIQFIHADDHQGVGRKRVTAAHLALHTPKAELQARTAAGAPAPAVMVPKVAPAAL